jgi:hypothetical protein
MLQKQEEDDFEFLLKKLESDDNESNESYESSEIEEPLDFTDVSVSCVCKKCGFKCSARNYMNS